MGFFNVKGDANQKRINADVQIFGVRLTLPMTFYMDYNERNYYVSTGALPVTIPFFLFFAWPIVEL